MLVEMRRGKPAQLRLLSPSCPVDGAGMRLVWLGSVDSGASLAYLERLFESDERDGVAQPAVGAVAYHDDARADAIIERRALDTSLDEDSRQQALFWAGSARGESGCRLLDRILDSEKDPDVRAHAIFALTQCGTPAAIERIKKAGVEDRSPDVRGQALFWLAESDAPGAGEWILSRMDAERSEDVREQAVFALSQLDDGTDWLLQVLRSKRDPDLIRRALFWLGQSEDPRALEELQRILER